MGVPTDVVAVTGDVSHIKRADGWVSFGSDDPAQY